jgi:hypothetical protein
MPSYKKRSASLLRLSLWRKWLGKLTATLLLCAFTTSFALEPAWWANGVIAVDAGGVRKPADDWATLNQGQLKNIAVAAYLAMEAKLPGGAGTTPEMVALKNMLFTSGTLTPKPSANGDDYVQVNIGQLKNAAKPFYDRLAHVYGASVYPWPTNLKPADDWALANIGQAKSLFSFNIVTPTEDTDSDALPDLWELQNFGSLAPTGSDDPDGDEESNSDEYQDGTDPKDYFNGQTPNLTIVSGTGQSGGPGDHWPTPVRVFVSDATGTAKANAPVAFRITEATLVPEAEVNSPRSQELSMRTTGDGIAGVIVWLPPLRCSFAISIQAGSGTNVATVGFTGAVASGAGSRPPTPPFVAPTSIPEPYLHIRTSHTYEANPAFRQFTEDEPVRWYLTKTKGSENHFSHQQGTLYKETDTGTYHSLETRHPFTSPSTFSGTSTYDQTVEDSDLVTKQWNHTQNPDASWIGTYRVVTRNAPGDVTINTSTPGWTGAFRELQSESATTLIYYENDDYSDAEISQEGYTSDWIVLSAEYTRDQFCDDVTGRLPALGTEHGSSFGTPIAWRHLNADGSGFDVQKADYCFKSAISDPGNPMAYQWYEVFQPDDNPDTPEDEQQQLKVRGKIWPGANSSPESDRNVIDPDREDQNGVWYLARLSVECEALAPACRWRYVVGVGEVVDFTLTGIPDTIAAQAQWTVDNAEAGSFASAKNEIARFRVANPANDTICNVRVTLPGDAVLSETLSIRRPTGVHFDKIPPPDPYARGEAGAGMWVQYRLLPDNVSFKHCQYVEMKCPATNVTGSFRDMSDEALMHNPNDGGQVPTPDPNTKRWEDGAFFDDNRAKMLDHAAFKSVPDSGPLVFNPDPFRGGGGLTWKIPVRYRIDTQNPLDPDGEEFAIVTQTFHLDANGDALVTKNEESEPRPYVPYVP